MHSSKETCLSENPNVSKNELQNDFFNSVQFLRAISLLYPSSEQLECILYDSPLNNSKNILACVYDLLNYDR